MAFVEFRNVSKIYNSGQMEIKALDDINFTIEKGELTVIIGASGAGKTTLLNILGGMDFATKGNVYLENRDICNLSRRELIQYRRNEVGFVFQFYNLIQNLTALENVELATQICRNALSAEEALKKVGLEDRMNNFPSQLSGGEQQRTAIARAIAKNPKLLLCDEPTGALDYKSGKLILKLLQEAGKDLHHAVVIITHNQAFTSIANKVIKMQSGKILEVVVNKNILPADIVEW